MKQYGGGDIRNIVFAGHDGTGKTSLIEAILYRAGAIDRAGTLAGGNLTCDYDQEEIKRRVSLNLALAAADYNGTKLNLLDTPGQVDFSCGLYEGIRAAETAAICVPAKDGVQVGAVNAYKRAVKEKKARVIIVTKADEENANFYKVLEELKFTFGPSVCPVIVPFDKNGYVESYINVVEGKAYKYENGKGVEIPLPVGENRYKGLRAAMAEAVAETDEELMLRYFDAVENGGEDTAFTADELIKGIHDGIDAGTITPVVCCSATTGDAVDLLLDVFVKMLPSAFDLGGEAAASGEKFEGVTAGDFVHYDDGKPFSAFVFKTIADPFAGRISLFKVVTGEADSKTDLINVQTGEYIHFGKIFTLLGKKQLDVTKAVAGDIVCATKLDAHTNDTLCATDARAGRYHRIHFPAPCTFRGIEPVDKNDEVKLSSALQKELQEDLTLSFTSNAETRQRLLGGLGETHLEVTMAKLKNKYGLNLILTPPVVAYREMIRKKVSVEGKHRKQSGGHGQFGHIKIEFEPSGDTDGRLVFAERVFGGSVPKNYFPAVEKGVLEAMEHGVLAGYPVVGLKATLFDGSYHPVDSSEMAFKLAAHIAYKTGLPTASPCILEPIHTAKIYSPDETTGDIISLLNKKRGSVLGMISVEDVAGFPLTEITAELPAAELSDLAAVIRRVTRGAGTFTAEFARYEQLPQQLEADVIKNAPKVEYNA
ncbi:elongation factor G [Clostridia bacterium]|nr:elongation factor G [Clostridia bacterium]